MIKAYTDSRDFIDARHPNQNSREYLVIRFRQSCAPCMLFLEYRSCFNKIWRPLCIHATVVVAQWIERPPSVLEVMGSIPVGDSQVFFGPRWCHVKDQFTFHISFPSLKFTIFIHLSLLRIDEPLQISNILQIKRITFLKKFEFAVNYFLLLFYSE